MEDVLKEGTDARKLAVSLQHVQYGEQLVAQLFKHSSQMEKLYGAIQQLASGSKTKEKKFEAAIDMATEKMKWFEKSKGTSVITAFPKATKCLNGFVP